MSVLVAYVVRVVRHILLLLYTQYRVRT